MNRNFIISSVYLAGEDVPVIDVDQSATQRLLNAGVALVAQHRKCGVLDLSRLITSLHRAVFDGDLTPVARGVFLARVLEELEGSDWITVAAELAHGLNNAQLDGIGSAGLLALTRALKAGCPERCERGLERVLGTLKHRAPVELSEAGGLFIISDGWGVTEPSAQKVVKQALPELRGRLGGCVVVAVDEKEKNTSRALLIEHYRRCADVLTEGGLATLERAQKFGRIHLLPQEQLMAARAKSLSERAWTVWGWVDAVIKPVRERIFVPV